MKCDEPKRERSVSRIYEKIQFDVTECARCKLLEPVDKENKEAVKICNEYNSYRFCKLDKKAEKGPNAFSHPTPFFEEKTIFTN